MAKTDLDLLPLRAVADLFGVQPHTLSQQRWLDRPPGNLGIRIGRQVLFRRSDLAKFLDEQASAERRERDLDTVE